MKKAQGISVNVIVIAALALLVLVVLAAIFIGKIGGWGKEVDSCTNKGGRCAEELISCGEEGTAVEEFPTEYATWKCPEKGQRCCIKA